MNMQWRLMFLKATIFHLPVFKSDQLTRARRPTHGITLIRRKKNKVDVIQHEDGRWISNPLELESYV